MSRVLFRYANTGDMITDARRAQDEEWRAMHRRPDAPPLPPAPAREPLAIRISIAALVRRVTRLRFSS